MSGNIADEQCFGTAVHCRNTVYCSCIGESIQRNRINVSWTLTPSEKSHQSEADRIRSTLLPLRSTLLYRDLVVTQRKPTTNEKPASCLWAANLFLRISSTHIPHWLHFRPISFHLVGADASPAFVNRMPRPHFYTGHCMLSLVASATEEVTVDGTYPNDWASRVVDASSSSSIPRLVKLKCGRRSAGLSIRCLTHTDRYTQL